MIRPIRLADLLLIQRDFRPIDMMGLKSFSSIEEDGPDRWAASAYMQMAYGYTLEKLGEIVAIVGYVVEAPGELYVWCVATPRLKGHSFGEALKFIESLHNGLFANGVKKIRCMVMSDFSAGHRVARRLTFEPCGVKQSTKEAALATLYERTAS